MKHKLCTCLGVGFLGLAVCASVLFYRYRNGEHVYLVVPNDYTGPVIFYFNKEDYWSWSNTIRIEVPQDGVVRLNHGSVFAHWHELHVTRVHGASLPVGNPFHDADKYGKDTIVFWSLWSQSDNSVWYYIGTHDACRKFMQQHER